MSCLSDQQKSQIIAALCEGLSIRSTERLFDIHRDTIMRLGVKVGQGCAILHDRMMVDLRVNRIEMDEIWSFVKKKKRNVRADEPETVGEQFIYMAMDGTGKAILSWLVGKRDTRNTIKFVQDVKRRVLGNPEISTDGYAPYIRAVDEAFEGQADHGIVDKQTVFTTRGPDAPNNGARAAMTAVRRTAINGKPKQISTSYIERQNLTMRMSSRRLTRLSNGFSRKFENHCAAVSLYAGHYNFCRVHDALRVTPAMQLGVTDHVWTIGELIQAALTGEIRQKPETMRGAFRVIQGGRA